MPKHTTIIESALPILRRLEEIDCKICPGIIVGKFGSARKAYKFKEISGGYLLKVKDGGAGQKIYIYGDNLREKLTEIGLI